MAVTGYGPAMAANDGNGERRPTTTSNHPGHRLERVLRGLAAVDPERRRAIARAGGLAVAREPGRMSRLGRKGGKARAKALTPERRSAIARHAITSRWKQYRAAKKSAA